MVLTSRTDFALPGCTCVLRAHQALWWVCCCPSGAPSDEEYWPESHCPRQRCCWNSTPACRREQKLRNWCAQLSKIPFLYWRKLSSLMTHSLLLHGLFLLSVFFPNFPNLDQNYYLFVYVCACVQMFAKLQEHVHVCVLMCVSVCVCVCGARVQRPDIDIGLLLLNFPNKFLRQSFTEPGAH